MRVDQGFMDIFLRAYRGLLWHCGAVVRVERSGVQDFTETSCFLGFLDMASPLDGDTGGGGTWERGALMHVGVYRVH